MVLPEQIQSGDVAVGAEIVATKNRPGNVDRWFDVDRSHELGRGQYGVSYRATDKHNGQVKAVKLIDRKGYTGDPAREMDEVVLSQKIHHPRCVGVEEIFCTEDEIQVVQEIMEGGDLMHYMMARLQGSGGWL